MDTQIPKLRHIQSPVLRYAVAVLSVAVALGLMTLSQPLLRPPSEPPFQLWMRLTPLFFAAVMISAWYGGLGAGLLASLLAVLAIDFFLFSPVHTLSFGIEDLPLLLVFVLTTMLIDRESRTRRRAEADLRTALEDLDSRVQERTRELADANARMREEGSERERSEAALRESERRYRELFENANDMVYTLDLDGNLTAINATGERITGYSRDELLGTPIAALAKPDALVRIQQMYERKLKGERLTTYELEITAKDGRSLVLEISSRLILEEAKPVGIQGIARDVTRRKEAEEAVRLSEERYRTLVDGAQQLIWLNNPEGHNIYVNRRWREYTGLDAPVQRDVDWYTLTHPDDIATVRRVRTRGLSAEEPYECEFRIRRSDGVYRWHLLRTVPMRGADGSLIQWLGTGTDIHSIKLAEESERFLAESSATLTSLLDYQLTLDRLAHLVVAWLADWCIIDMLEDADLRPLAIAHRNPETEPQLRDMRSRCPVTNEKPSLVREVVSTGEAVLVSEVPGAPLDFYGDSRLQAIAELSPHSGMVVPLIARGRVLGVISMATLASNRSYTETDLALARDLARRAALAIDNARLYREAQEANRLKDEFLATVSHELRTPLNAIMGWAEMLRADRLDDELKPQAHEIIVRNARLQAQIIEDILDVSRIITGKLRIEVKPVDLVAVVTTVIEAVRPGAQAKHIALDVGFDGTARVVSGDASRLQQVVWNLLSNAIKFTRENGHVSIHLGREGANALVTVKDDGCGIEPDFLPHVFDRFRQADSSYTRQHGGLGLGLAIVRHLLEIHGGSVTAESAGSGRGSTFTIILPLLRGDAEPSPDMSDEILPETIRGPADWVDPPLARLWLLVVDDEQDARELLAKTLGRTGARVTCASSASEAMAILSAGDCGKHPDVLLADIGMPGEDGLALIERIRRSPDADTRRIPAIALTAYARAEDRARALEAGYHQHIAKPFAADELVRAIAALAEQADGA